MNIMIVDDDQVSRLSIARALEGLGTPAPLQVCSGQAAMQALKQGFLPDLIITDVRMPEIDGVGMLYLLRQDIRFAPLPVMMVTSSPEPDVVRRAMQIGVQGFILKPVTQDACVRARSVVDRFHASMVEGQNGATSRLSISPLTYWSYLRTLVAQSRKLVAILQASGIGTGDPAPVDQAGIHKLLEVCLGLGKMLCANHLKKVLAGLERLFLNRIPLYDSRYSELLQAIELNLHWLGVYINQHDARYIPDAGVT